MSASHPFRMVVVVFATVALSVSDGRSDTPSPDVPLHHPVYRFLSMIPFPGRVGEISLSNRPFSEAQVCSLLVYAKTNHLVSDTALVGYYFHQFATSPLGGPSWAPPGTIQFDGLRTFASPYAYTRFAVQDSCFSDAGFSSIAVDSISGATEMHNATAVGLRMRSYLGTVLLFFDASINTEYSTLKTWEKAFDPRTGVFQTPILTDSGAPGHFMGYDEFNAYLKLRLPWFDLKAGNDRTAWGYRNGEGLLLSGAGRPFLHLKIDRSLGQLHYTFLYGRLIGDTFRERRVLYAKRTIWTPRDWLTLGLSDAVITVNRDFEPMYLFPVLPYYFTEHFLGDQDNRTMSFDCRARLWQKAAVHGELFLDDISNLLGMFSNKSWGDKWGVTTDVTVFNLLPWFPASAAMLQFSQLEPWVYTTSARVDLEANNYPINFGRPLGSQLGPHSRALSLSLDGQLSRRCDATLAIARYWKGHGPGSSIFDRNSVILDTVNGSVVQVREYETKEYRFTTFDRNRTLFSASSRVWWTPWLCSTAEAKVALEQIPRRTGLYSAALGVRVQY